MSIHVGVDGVVRQIGEPRAGIWGVMHFPYCGICGVDNVARQFYGVDNWLESVAVVVDSADVWETNSDGDYVNSIIDYATKAELAQYCTLTIGSNYISIRSTSSHRNKFGEVYATCYAVAKSGYRVPLEEAIRNCKASISWPVGYRCSFSGSGSGRNILDCCGTSLVDSWYDSASGTKIITELDFNNADVGSAITSSSGSQTIRMNFTSPITINGKLYPVSVLDEVA